MISLFAILQLRNYETDTRWEQKYCRSLFAVIDDSVEKLSFRENLLHMPARVEWISHRVRCKGFHRKVLPRLDFVCEKLSSLALTQFVKHSSWSLVRKRKEFNELQSLKTFFVCFQLFFDELRAERGDCWAATSWQLTSKRLKGSGDPHSYVLWSFPLHEFFSVPRRNVERNNREGSWASWLQPPLALNDWATPTWGQHVCKVKEKEKEFLLISIKFSYEEKMCRRSRSRLFAFSKEKKPHWTSKKKKNEREICKSN